MDGFKEAGTAGNSWDGIKPVQGVYMSKKTGVGKHSSNVYSLEVNAEQIDVWGSTVLDTKFEEIPIGSTVRIEPLGETTSKTGSVYKDYKVFYKVTEIEKVFPGAKEVL